MSFYYRDRNNLEAVAEYTKKTIDELQKLRTSFEQSVARTPSIILKHKERAAGEEFIKYGDNIATALIYTGSDIQQLFRIDFKRQLATIFTLQDNKICSTETKKISELPRQMIQEAQHIIRSNKSSDRHFKK